MKKTIWMGCIALMLGTLLLLSACSSAATTTQESKSPYQQGLELIALMEEMVNSEAYMQTYSQSLDIQQILEPVRAGDYGQPQAVYRITLSQAGIQSLSQAVGMDSMSDKLRSYMEERIQAAIATEINAAGGAMLLAASSICTASKTFVCQELTENAIYLYTYGDGAPAAVSFLRGEDGSVSATASFLLDESFPADDPEALEAYFQAVGAQVEALTEPA